MDKKCDFLIIGGGVIGSSIAMSLSIKGAENIMILDIDLEGKFSSSELNAGGVRALWGNEVNIALSKASIEFYETVREEIDFTQRGYLWLHGEASWKRIREKIKLHNDYGLRVEYLSPNEIGRLIPEVDRLDGIAGVTYSPKDGILDSHMLKEYFRREARKRGALFMDHTVVKEVRLEGRRVAVVTAMDFSQAVSEENIREALTKHRSELYSQRRTFHPKVLINAAGAWASVISKLYGIDTPSQAVRRQISVIHNRNADMSDYGMIIDASGVYLHPEGGNILSGFATPDEPPGYNFNYDGEVFFINYLWPRLYDRMSKFERCRHLRGWAGLYEVSKDRCAIIGKVEGMENVYECHSFSGRGVMQSYAAGLALAELIMEGMVGVVDISPLSARRFKEKKELFEGLII